MLNSLEKSARLGEDVPRYLGIHNLGMHALLSLTHSEQISDSLVVVG